MRRYEFYGLRITQMEKVKMVMAALLGVMMTGCAGNAERDHSPLVATGLYQPQEISNLSELIEIVDVVPLATNDSSLIAQVNQMRSDGERFYVYDKPWTGGNPSVKIFGRDGRFIRTVARTGEGPGELDPMKSVTINVARDTLYILNSDCLMTYTADGDFIESRKIPYDVAWDFEVTDGGGFVFNVGRDSLVYHVTDPSFNELVATYSANSLTGTSYADPIVRMPDGRLLLTVLSVNEMTVYDPSDGSASLIPLADIPGMEELAAYESTVKKNKFGLPEGTLSGTVSHSIGASDSQRFVITGTPDRTEMRLWATVAPENRQVVSLDDVADDITHSRHGARRYFYTRMDGPEFTVTFTPEELIEGIGVGASADPRIDSLNRVISPEANPVVVTYRLKTR